MSSTSQVRQVKEATDIVDVIGERLNLQLAGTYHKGLCPFHSEKSPSFFVSDQMQRYKCFGCGESGDAFEFLQKYEGMTFYESLKYLADQAGITLEQHAKTPEDDHREKILEVLDLAKEYYHYLLTKHEVGQEAREYLKDRGIHSESIKLFKIGFSVVSWDGVINYLHKKKKYSLELLSDAGLIIQGKGGRYYDRFRGRVMFPLTNHRGQTVGFSGRVLDPQAKDAKYINSPETLVYHKSELLFGLSQLYQFIRKQRRVIVVEGEFDVISSSQANVNIIVAIKGSALTQEHAKLLRRTVDVVLLALDTDSAGVEATKKAIITLRETQVELRVVQIPSGKDPDDLIRSDPGKWREVVKQSVSAYEFLIAVSLKQHDPDTPEGKRAIMKELGPILAQLEHAVELEHYVKELAESLNVQPEVVKQDITRSKRMQQQNGSKQSDRHEKSLEYSTKQSPPAAMTRKMKLEQYLLFLLLQQDGPALAKKAAELAKLELSTVGTSQVLAALIDQGDDVSLETVTKRLPEDLQQKVFAWYSNQDHLKNIDRTDIDTEWHQQIAELKKEQLKAKKDQITKELAELDKKLTKSDVETAKQDGLLKELAQLTSAQRPS